MSTSSEGSTWSAVQRIPLDPPGSGFDYRTPGLAVDTATAGGKAHLALAFYSFTNANCFTYNCQLDVGFVSSINGGASWSAKERLAGPMQLSWLADTSSGFMTGDYIATSIVGNNAFPVFAVAAPPAGGFLNEAMYSAAVPVTGGAMTAQEEQAVAARHVHLVPPGP